MQLSQSFHRCWIKTNIDQETFRWGGTTETAGGRALVPPRCARALSRSPNCSSNLEQLLPWVTVSGCSCFSVGPQPARAAVNATNLAQAAGPGGPSSLISSPESPEDVYVFRVFLLIVCTIYPTSISWASTVYRPAPHQSTRGDSAFSERILSFSSFDNACVVYELRSVVVESHEGGHCNQKLCFSFVCC